MAGTDAVAFAVGRELQAGLDHQDRIDACRLLVESAWHYSRPPRLGATLANRQAGQPEHVLAISNRAQQRLFKVSRQMKARGKPHHVTVVACARQLAGFLWAAATAD